MFRNKERDPLIAPSIAVDAERYRNLSLHGAVPAPAAGDASATPSSARRAAPTIVHHSNKDTMTMKAPEVRDDTRITMSFSVAGR